MLRDIRWNDGDFVLEPGGRVRLAEGLEVIRQDLLARLVSPPGSHWAFPEEGMDLPRYVQGPANELTLLELRQEIELETLRDVRVLDALAEVEAPDPGTGRIRVVATLTDAARLEVAFTFGGNA